MRIECIMYDYDQTISSLAIQVTHMILAKQPDVDHDIQLLHVFEEAIKEAREMLEGSLR